MADLFPSQNTFGTSTPAISFGDIKANAGTKSVQELSEAAVAANKPTPSTNKPSSGSHFQAAAKAIPQTERLFTVRPRSTGYNKVNDRGPIARMRVLPLDRGLFPKDSPKDLFTGDDKSGWNEFFLTDVQCQMSEKAQVMEVFGDNHVAYYFGKSPTMFTLSGLVFDNIDNDWFTGLINTYENFIRGSKLAKNYALLEIILPNLKIIGSVMSLNYNQNSQRDTDIQFSMQILAKAVDMIPLSIPEVDQSNLLNVVSWPKAIGSLPKEALNTAKTYANLLSYLQSPVSSSIDILGLAGGITKAFSPLADTLKFSQLNNMNETADLSSAFGSVGGPVATLGSALTGFTNAAGSALSSLGTNLSFDPTYGTCGPGLLEEASNLASTAFKDFSSGTENIGDKITTSLSGALPSSLEGYWSKAGLAKDNVVLGGISSTLTGFKSGLFSPVFGFLSSITKIVTSVTGDISKVLMSFTAPVNSVLRDITGISQEVISVTNLITSSIGHLVGIPRQTLNNVMNTINSLRKAAGAISRMPINISDSFSALFHGGSISNGAVVLKSSHGRRIVPSVILSSGKPWTPTKSMVIPSNIRRLS